MTDNTMAKRKRTKNDLQNIHIKLKIVNVLSKVPPHSVTFHCYFLHYYSETILIQFWDHRGRDRMVVGFITTYVIIPYHH